MLEADRQPVCLKEAVGLRGPKSEKYRRLGVHCREAIRAATLTLRALDGVFVANEWGG